MPTPNITMTTDLSLSVHGGVITIERIEKFSDALPKHYFDVIDTRDQMIRAALIKLGWTPPQEKAPDLSDRG